MQAQLVKYAVNFVVNAPGNGGGKSTIYELRLVYIVLATGANRQQNSVVISPETVHRLLRKRHWHLAGMAWREHYVRALNTFSTSRVIEFDAQLGACAEKDGRLVGIHAQERIACIEEDRLRVALHRKRLSLRNAPARSCTCGAIAHAVPLMSQRRYARHR